MRNSSDAVTLNVKKSTDMDTYTYDNIAIMLDGKEVGTIGMVADENEPYLERIDIDEKYRNKGIGTDALRLVAEKYGEFIIAPDNEDAKRLYERYGEESNSDNAPYLDQGYGVYSIYSVSESKGYMARQKNVKYSMRGENWKPTLDKVEWRIVNYAIENKAGKELTETTDYFFRKEKGKTVFGIYSTDDSTLLYAVHGERAQQEYNFTKHITEDFGNGAYPSTKIPTEWVKGVRMWQSASVGNDVSALSSGGHGRNDTIYDGKYFFQSSGALRNVLKNIFGERKTDGSRGSGESGGNRGLTVSDLGKIQYQLRIEDKNRLDILDRQETRLTADLKTLEKAYAEAIRAEYERSIKPSEETSRRAAEINRKAAKRKPTEQKREPPAVVLFFICSARECSLLYHPVPAAAVQAAPQGSPPAHRQGKRPFRSSSYTPSMP